MMKEHHENVSSMYLNEQPCLLNLSHSCFTSSVSDGGPHSRTFTSCLKPVILGYFLVKQSF